MMMMTIIWCHQLLPLILPPASQPLQLIKWRNLPLHFYTFYTFWKKIFKRIFEWIFKGIFKRTFERRPFEKRFLKFDAKNIFNSETGTSLHPWTKIDRRNRMSMVHSKHIIFTQNIEHPPFHPHSSCFHQITKVSKSSLWKLLIRLPLKITTRGEIFHSQKRKTTKSKLAYDDGVKPNQVTSIHKCADQNRNINSTWFQNHLCSF